MRLLRVYKPLARGIRKLSMLLYLNATSKAALFPYTRSPSLWGGGETSHRMARLDESMARSIYRELQMTAESST